VVFTDWPPWPLAPKHLFGVFGFDFNVGFLGLRQSPPQSLLLGVDPALALGDWDSLDWWTPASNFKGFSPGVFTAYHKVISLKTAGFRTGFPPNQLRFCLAMRSRTSGYTFYRHSSPANKLASSPPAALRTSIVMQSRARRWGAGWQNLRQDAPLGQDRLRALLASRVHFNFG